jgi:hypothetical protein
VLIIPPPTWSPISPTERLDPSRAKARTEIAFPVIDSSKTDRTAPHLLNLATDKLFAKVTESSTVTLTVIDVLENTEIELPIRAKLLKDKQLTILEPPAIDMRPMISTAPFIDILLSAIAVLSTENELPSPAKLPTDRADPRKLESKQLSGPVQ